MGPLRHHELRLASRVSGMPPAKITILPFMRALGVVALTKRIEPAWLRTYAPLSLHGGVVPFGPRLQRLIAASIAAGLGCMSRCVAERS